MIWQQNSLIGDKKNYWFSEIMNLFLNILKCNRFVLIFTCNKDNRIEKKIYKIKSKYTGVSYCQLSQEKTNP